MRILIAHNKYHFGGGEDAMAEAETALLSENGHTVERHTVSNRDVSGLAQWIKVASRSTYSAPSRERMRERISAFKPDIVHVHNFFPQLTTSIYDACSDAGVPVVQTLHNFRVTCPKATLFRNGGPCEVCIEKSPYHAVLYGCYRSSRLQSIVPARMVSVNRRRNIWARKVDRFIALTDFARDKFIEAGLPADRIDTKPNFADPPRMLPDEVKPDRKGALFVGRLTEEKGLDPLLEAWRDLTVPLRIVGDGPLAGWASGRAGGSVELVGRLSGEDVSRELAQAAFLVFPSISYETFGLVIVEAFAHGLPVLASRLGSMAEIVENGVTGLHFEPGDPEDLAKTVRWASDNPDEMKRMGANARRVYESKFTPEANYPQLMEIYRKARETSLDGRIAQ